MSLRSKAMPRFSFKIAPIDISWEQMARLWRAADADEFFSAGWLLDHFYPSRGPVRPTWESWTLLSSLAAVTSRLDLGVMVSSNTFRHPALLAHMAASVDEISAGRLQLGLGAGWNEVEHEAFGLDLGDPPARWGRLGEALEIIDGLLTRDSFSFTGRHFTLRDAQLAHKPTQRPRPPFVIGGIGPKRTLPLVARWADHWNYFNPARPPEVLADYLERLAELCAAAGRDLSDIEVSAQVRMPEDVDELTDVAGRLIASGADHIVVTAFAPFDDATVPRIASGLTPLV